jgi:hypothetical protein
MYSIGSPSATTRALRMRLSSNARFFVRYPFIAMKWRAPCFLMFSALGHMLGQDEGVYLGAESVGKENGVVTL